MTRRAARRLLVLSLALAGTGCVSFHVAHSTPAAAPSAASLALHAEILGADSAMFAAYDAHDAPRLMSHFTKDLEFYHDTGGLLTWSQVSDGFTSVFKQSGDIHRVLVGDVEVYPIKGYGAVEIGMHRFCHTEHGKDDCGTFKFVQLWKKGAEGWQLSRVVSVGH